MGSGQVDRFWPHFLTGKKIHLLTHAHAIATFEELGYDEIASLAVEAHHSLARLVEASRSLAPSRVEPVRHTPFDTAFWQQESHDPAHVIKLAEAVVTQLPRLSDEESGVAIQRLSRLWALLGIR